ncbi:ty3-gypsy retrotransposon protein [Cucumis melo var. makuwa]|nr:ty3-gypsy retrotransposon protein [Cucumis melo var. makuwa]
MIIEEKEPKGKELATLEVKGDNTTYVELSINSVVGLNDPVTMKVREKLQEEEVVILIDCGATHNFISDKLVKRLHLLTKETAHYGVILGSGTTIQGKGICEVLEVQLKDRGRIFYPWNLERSNIILGTQWLHSLRVTVVDWKIFQ